MPLLAINHHYIRDTRNLNGIYPVSLKEILKRTELASKHFRFISQNELIDVCTKKIKENLAIITFDDGLQEQAIAAQKLREAGIKSICFVPSKPYVDNRLLDVHRIHLLRSRMSDAQVDQSLVSYFGKHYIDVNIEEGRKQYRYDTNLAVKIKYFLNFILNQDDRESWSAPLFENLFGSESTAASELYMSLDALTELSKHDQIGSHAHSHKALAQMPAFQQRNDLALSVEILHQITGKIPRGIAYPYGGPSAVDDQTIRVAKEIGFRFGFTMHRGLTDLDGNQHSLALNRIDTNDTLTFLNSFGEPS